MNWNWNLYKHSDEIIVLVEILGSLGASPLASSVDDSLSLSLCNHAGVVMARHSVSNDGDE